MTATSAMSTLTRDPLLAIAKGLLWFLMASMVVGIAACLVAVPLLLFFRNDISVEMAKEMPLVLPQFCSARCCFASFSCSSVSSAPWARVIPSCPRMPFDSRRWRGSA